MPTVVFVGLLLIGLALGFYVTQKVRSFARSNTNSSSNFLLSQAKSQLRRFVSGFGGSKRKDRRDTHE